MLDLSDRKTPFLSVRKEENEGVISGVPTPIPNYSLNKRKRRLIKY